MIKSHKHRIYPNLRQQELLSKTFGCTRYLWNSYVDKFNSYVEGETIKDKTTTEYRKELEWMREISAAALQQKQMDFKEFKKRFFDRLKKGEIEKLRKSYISKRLSKGLEIDNKKLYSLGKPNFKKKQDKQSYRLPNQKFSIENNKIRIEKIGWVNIKMERCIPTDAKLLSVTISMNSSGKYYASINFETNEIIIKNKTGKSVGLDLGIKCFSTQSDGIEIENPKNYSKNQAKLRILQKHLSRKKKGSNRYAKCRIKIAKLHDTIANKRSFFLHNYSTSLINNYDYIYIEDLDVKGMLESKLMSKFISDVSWSEFVRQLEYKADWYGKTVHKVNRYYASSKTCRCGVKNNRLTLSDREWVCGSCGTINQRDELASQNILKEGRRSLGDITDVETEVTKSVKR